MKKNYIIYLWTTKPPTKFVICQWRKNGGYEPYIAQCICLEGDDKLGFPNDLAKAHLRMAYA